MLFEVVLLVIDLINRLLVEPEDLVAKLIKTLLLLVFAHILLNH